MQKHLQKLLLVVAMMLVPWVTQAQTLGEYTFSTGTSTSKWIDMSSATQILSPTGSDGLASSVRNIGFSFPFGEDGYTQYSVNTDGNLRLGSTVTGTGNYSTPFSSANASINNPKINFFGCDGYGVSGSHYVKALNTVDADNDSMLCVEFCTGTYISSTRDYLYKWQVHLYTDGDIEIVYGTAPSTNPAVTRQQGLCVDASDGWTVSASHVATHFTAGTSTTIASGTWPSEGRYYRFERPVVPCPRPTSLTASNLTPTSFDIQWTDTTDATSWLMSIAEGNSAATVTEVYTTSYSFTALTPNTPYTVAVAGLCGNGDTSHWRTLDLRTACSYINTLPYFNDFEDEPYYLSGTTSYAEAFPNCWTRINDASGTYNYYPYINTSSTYLIHGGKSMYWYHTTTTTYADNEYAVLPPFDPDVYEVNDLVLSFWAKTTATAAPWPLFIVGVMTNPTDATTFVPVDTITLTTTAMLYAVNFANYTGTGNYIAIRCPRTTSARYCSLDDVFLTDEWCDIPTNVTASATTTEVTVSWNTNGGSSFTLVFGGDTLAGISDSSYTFTGLTPNTPYAYAVATECGSSLSSFIAGSIRTECTALDSLPYTQTFETAVTGSGSSATFVDCMYRLNNGTTYYGYPYVGGSTYNHTPGGAKGLYWYNNTTTGTYGDYQVVVMPRVDANDAPINTLQLSFWARPSSTSYSPVFIVGVMTDPEDISTFQSVATVNVLNTTDWQFFEIPLYPYIGDGEYVALRANRPSSSWYAYVDDLTIENAPACPRIGDVVARNITQTDATIGWTASTADEYEVQYGPAGFTLGTGTTVNFIYGDSVDITGLNPGTMYDVYVRGICSTDSSNWSFVYQFHTECSYATLPIIENFDAITGSTATSGMANILPPCWDYYNDGTRTNYQGSPYVYSSTTYAHSGSNCIRFYSYNSSGDSNQYLILPVFDSNEYVIADLQLSFWLRGNSTSSNYFNNVVVGVMTDPNNEYSFIPYDTILSSTTTYTYHEVNLNRYNGPHGRVTMLFPKPASSSQYEYGYVDDLMLGPLPTCLSVDDLTAIHITGDSITLQWTSGGDESSWEVSYGSVTDIVYDTVYDAYGLSPNTEYTFTVRAICGAGDTSYPVSYTTRTDCGPTPVPFTENFDTWSSTAADPLPSCWDKHTNYSTNYPYASTSYNHSTGGSKSMYMYSTNTTYSYMVLPLFDLPVDSTMISFWLYKSNTSYAHKLQVGVMTNPADVNTFVQVAEVVPTLSSAWEEFEVPLSSYNGTGTRIAIMSPNNEYSYPYLDDLTVTRISDCPRVVDISAANVMLDSAIITWTDGSNTAWYVEYDSVNFTPGTHTPTYVTDTSIVLSGLSAGTIYHVYVYPDCDSTAYRYFSFTTLAALPATLPYSCDFEAAGVNGWDLLNGSEGNYWIVGNATSNGGSRSMYITDDGTANSYSGSASYVFATRTFSMAAGNYICSYDWKVQGESSFDFIRAALVPASTELTPGQYSGFDNASAMPAGSIALDGGYRLNLAGSSWTTQTTEFTLTSAGTYKLVFLWRNDGSVYNQPPAAIDNVALMLNSCPMPQNITLSNLTQTSADVSWHEAGTATEWQYQVGSGSITTVYDTNCSLTGLSANTPYTFRVRAICGVGDTGMWATYTFRTPCGYITLPYTQDFESEPTGSSSTGSAFVNCWTRLNNGTSYGGYPYVSSSSTYNHTAGGTKGLYWCNNTTTGTYGDYQIVALPPVDSSVSVSSLQLSFWAKASSTSYTPVFHVGVMTDPNNPSTFVSLDTITIAGNTNWAQFEIPLANYTGSGQYVALRALRPSSSWYAYVDDFDLDYIPTCISSRNVHSTAATTTSLTIDWTDYSTPYAWEISYTGNGITNNTTVMAHPATITGLTPATAYQIRVRPICSATDTGRWSEPCNATTGCDLIVPPYVQDFDALTGTSYSTAGVLPPCWDGYSNGTTAAYMPHVTNGGTYSYSINGNSLTLTSGSASYGDVKYVRLPQFATPVNTLTMSYWFCTESSTNGTLTVGYMTGPDFTTDFVPITSHAASSASYHSGDGAQPAGVGVYDTVSFSSVPANALYVAFKWVYTTSYYSCCIDNIEVTSSAAVCAAPSITSTTGDYQSATMTWTGSGTNYEVNIKEAMATDWPATDIAVTGNTYTFNGLQPATNYTFRVRQDCNADSLGYSEWTIGAFVTDSMPCLAPDSLTVTAVTNATATFDWTPIGTESAWQIHVWYSGGIDSIYTVTTRPATVGGFTANTTYNAAIRPLCGSAHNIVGEWGDTITFTTAVCPDVTGLTSSDLHANDVTLSWTADPLAQSWIIEYGYHGFDQGTGTTITTNLTTYTINGLMDDMQYDFLVRAVCGTDWQSEGWAIVTATTESGGVTCDAPTNVSAVVAGNSATVSWTANTGNISFELEYGTRGFARGSGTTLSATTSPVTLSNLDYDTEYDVYVQAICDVNTRSAWSTVASFTTEPQGSDECDPVTDLNASNVTENSALLSWTPGATGDEWEVVLTTAAGTTVSEASTTEHQYALTGLTPGTGYVAKVRTVCGDGVYSTFASTSFSTLTVGIDGVAEPACTIYPNPTSSATTITVTGINGKVKIAVVDINGREVTSETLDCSGDCAKSFDVDRLAQGAYFVRITGENVSMVRKLIVR